MVNSAQFRSLRWYRTRMTTTPEQDEVLTYPQAAAVLQVGESTLRRYVAEGKIKPSRIGGHVRFVRSELLRQISALSSAPEGDG